MKNPQTFAEEIKDNVSNIAKYGCCAFTALWTVGVEPDEDGTAIGIINDAINAGVIENDCTVKWIEFYKWLTGRTVKVEFRDIKCLKELKGVKTWSDRIPVRFDYKGKSHWVGVQNGEVRFNSLKHSNCVEFGKPATARIITLV